MNKDLVRKLTSRKFWVSLTSFITALLTALNVADNEIAQVTAIIMAFGSLIAYVLSEAYVDGKAVEGDVYVGGSDEI